jgi:flagellar protein FlaG
MNISSINNLAAQAGVPAETGVPRAANEDQRTLIRAVKAVNATEMFGQDNELTFFLDRNSRRAVVRIVNKKTREVVQQIPPEYVLRMAEEIKRS